MKFERSSSEAVTNLGERHVSQFDADGMVHIMSILSNLYGDSKAAVLREYVANGIDSHKSAGYTGPVEVSLPRGTFATYQTSLTIRDHGIGMSHDDVVRIYNNYGSSTKRDSNGDIGGFGIGGKSAYTVADQFTVEAVKDGRKTIAIMSMDAGVPGCTVVSVSETDAGNGVTVKIPVDSRESDEWRRVADTAFYGFRPGVVQVDGAPTKSLYENARQLSDAAWYDITRSRYSDPRVVVEGVVYSIPYTVQRSLDSSVRNLLSSGMFLEVPNGTVDIRPDREGLRDTSRTISAIEKVARETMDAIKDQMDAELLAAGDDFDRVVIASRFLDDLNFLRLEGVRPKVSDLRVAANVRRSGPRGGYSVDTAMMVNSQNFGQHYVFVTGCNGDEGKVSRVLKRWMQENHRGFNAVLLPGDTLAQGWWRFDPEVHTSVDAATVIEEGKALSAGSGSSGPRGQVTYEVWTRDAATGSNSSADMTISDIRGCGKKVVLTRRYLSSGEDSILANWLNDKAVVIVDGAKKMSVAESRFPGSLGEGDIRKACSAAWDAVSAEERAAAALDLYTRRGTADFMELLRVDHPLRVRYNEWASMTPERRYEVRNIARAAGQALDTVDVFDSVDSDTIWAYNYYDRMPENISDVVLASL